jgi:hypothetical protein
MGSLARVIGRGRKDGESGAGMRKGNLRVHLHERRFERLDLAE